MCLYYHRGIYRPIKRKRIHWIPNPMIEKQCLAMEVDIPDWFDEMYVEKILQKAENDESIKVSGLTATAATSNGDNYSSDIHRVAVEYSRVQDGREIREGKNLIVKYAPYGDEREEIVERSGLFRTELSVLTEILPRMNEFLEKAGQMTALGAQCFHVQYEKPTHVIVEDLAVKGFRLSDRCVGLDLDHSSLAMRKLARFHAASIALEEKDPKLVTRYSRGRFHKDLSFMLENFFNFGAKALAKETAKWPELNPRITKKILELSEVLFEKMCEAVLYREDDFNVLNHGDLWVNNMLFRYDELQRPIDVTFVDFQVSNWGSPAIDLLDFIGMSTSDEVRRHHRQLLLREYHTFLSSTMSKLRCSTEAPSFEKLEEILRHRAFIEVGVCIVGLPIALLEKGEEINLCETQKTDDGYKNPGYRGATYRKIMTRLLPLFDSMGLLDV